METHDPDPKAEDSPDPWTTFHEELGGLGERLRDTYRKVSDGDGPSEEEVKEALGVLAGVWNQIAGSVTTALQDPEVREKLKTAAGSLAAAVGTTISELGSEIRTTQVEEEE